MQTKILDKNGWLKKYDLKKGSLSRRSYIRVKRFFDLIIVISSAPLWLPIIIIIAIVVMITSPGAPVIFTQLRTGRGGRRFCMYKFRSMIPDAEGLKLKYAHLNELRWPDFKITNDPRITPFGRILRKSSLDELPQLINVIFGDMSLVGPRPTSFSAENYELWHTERLDVLPGITGLWQVCGRGELEFDERLRLDIAYIERASLSLDIEILFRTVYAVLSQRGAH